MFFLCYLEVGIPRFERVFCSSSSCRIFRSNPLACGLGIRAPVSEPPSSQESTCCRHAASMATGTGLITFISARRGWFLTLRHHRWESHFLCALPGDNMLLSWCSSVLSYHLWLFVIQSGKRKNIGWKDTACQTKLKEDIKSCPLRLKKEPGKLCGFQSTELSFKMLLSWLTPITGTSGTL